MMNRMIGVEIKATENKRRRKHVGRPCVCPCVITVSLLGAYRSPEH